MSVPLCTLVSGLGVPSHHDSTKHERRVDQPHHREHSNPSRRCDDPGDEDEEAYESGPRVAHATSMRRRLGQRSGMTPEPLPS
jgi:hypothetical protein